LQGAALRELDAYHWGVYFRGMKVGTTIMGDRPSLEFGGI
jgi:hypothetical protein